MGSVRVAIVGVGNCAASLVQGVEYYRDADPQSTVPGLMHVQLGDYHVRDVEFVAAFDVDAKKVGFDLSEATVTLRGTGARALTVAAAPPRPAATLADNIRFALTETDTDRLLVTAPGVEGASVLRCDFVRGDRGEEIWIAWPAVSSEEWRPAAQAGAWSLGPGWKLPLTLAPDAPGDHPPVLVFRERSAADAAHRVQTLVAGTWGIPEGRARLEKITCTPAELERRVLGEQTVRRLVARSTPRGPAVRTCERCGQPLTDPSSVALGIGPECRKYYSAEILRAVKTRSVVLPKPSAQKPTAWAQAIRDWCFDWQTL